MVPVLEIGNWLLPLLYLALLIDYGATFFQRRRVHGRSPWLLMVVAVHAVWIALRTAQLGHPPVTDSRELLTVLAIALAGVYAWVELAGRDRRTGVFVLLLVFLFQYTSSILTAPHLAAGMTPEEAAVPSMWTRIHIMPALVAYTATALAGVYGLLYLVARRSLREHRFGLLFDRLPPLDFMGPMVWQALVTSFVCLTITMAVTPFLVGGPGGDPITAKVGAKIITGCVAWIAYAAAILGRWLGRWSTARIAGIALVGFVAVMALLVASALLE
jgi:ABC-type uncharacterized transport system permease subunit